MHRNYDDIIQKGIAARATQSCFNQTTRPDKKAKKFIVTLKPVPKAGQDKARSECHCEKSAHEHGRPHLRTEDELRGKATILNAFRLLAHSKFITIDQNVSNSGDMHLEPPFNLTRLSGGSDHSIKQKEAKKQKKNSKKQEGKGKEDKPNEAKPKEDQANETQEEKKQKNIKTDTVSAETAGTSSTANKDKSVWGRKKSSKKDKISKEEDPKSTKDLASSSSPPPTPPDELVSVPNSKEKYVTEICKPRELKKHSEVIKNDGQNDLNVISNNSQRECHRIIHLEHQVEGMRGELSRIKREFIPQEDIMRYSALASRLQELNAMLAEMKRSCTASMATTPSTATSPSNYNNEQVQKVQNYRSCQCQSDCQYASTCGGKKPRTIACAAVAKATEECVHIHQLQIEKPTESAAKCFTNSGTQPETKPTTDSSVQVRRSPENVEHVSSQDRHSQTSATNLRVPKEDDTAPRQSRRNTLLELFPERTKITSLERRLTLLEHPLQLPKEPKEPCPKETPNKGKKSKKEPIKTNSSSSAQEQIEKNTEKGTEKKTVKPRHMPDNNSFCVYCDGVEVPIVNSNLQNEARNIILQRNPSDVALTIVLQADNLYHINIAVMKTGESLGCLFATENAINSANEEHVFEEFLTFFVVDANNTMEQKNKILGHTFEFIKN